MVERGNGWDGHMRRSEPAHSRSAGRALAGGCKDGAQGRAMFNYFSACVLAFFYISRGPSPGSVGCDMWHC